MTYKIYESIFNEMFEDNEIYNEDYNDDDNYEVFNEKCRFNLRLS